MHALVKLWSSSGHALVRLELVNMLIPNRHSEQESPWDRPCSGHVLVRRWYMVRLGVPSQSIIESKKERRTATETSRTVAQSQRAVPGTSRDSLWT